MTQQPQVPQVDPATLSDDAVILDVREPDEWAAGHAPRAVHIPLADLPARLGDLPEVPDALVVTCRGGGRSTRAVQWLTAQGFDAANLTGGMIGWQAAGRAVVNDGDGQPRVI